MDTQRQGLTRYEVAQRRRWADCRRLLDCGHVSLAVSEGRCWDCHLAWLRANGQDARADRLVVLKRQRAEGCVDYSRLVEGLIAAYEQRRVTTNPPAPSAALGIDRCRLPITRT